MPGVNGSNFKTGYNTDGSVLFLLPSIPGPSAGPASTWIPAAGWAQALAESGQRSWVVTPLGILDSKQTFETATLGRKSSTFASTTRGILPAIVGTLKKDIRDAFRGLRFRNAGLIGPWEQGALSFVWQRHELFQACGSRAAKHFGVPLVLFVDAPIVWESEKWGVSRPGWGKLLEHFVERHSLLSADLVCCISQAVAEKVRDLGVSEDRILVTPNATDLSHFRPQLDGQSIKNRYELEDTFVIGWVGSFRKFHGLDIVLSAVSELQAHFKDIALLMIGDGFEKDRIAKMAHHLRLDRVVFTGTIGYRELPQYINAMDLAVLSDSGTASYHYSPLKLQEYLACGRAVVAPRVGQISDYLQDRVDSLLVEPGSSAAMANAIELLYKNNDMRQRIGRNARRSALKHGGWSKIVNEVEDSLKRIHNGYDDPHRYN